jgi:hypothetical protein
MAFCIEFISGLYIGNSKVEDIRFINKKRISEIIYADKDLGFLGKWRGYATHLQEEVKKFEQEKSLEYLRKILIKINDILENGDKILIIDNTGVNFSSLIVLSYLIKYGEITLQQAIKSWNSKISFGVKMTNDCQNVLHNFIAKK